MRFKVVPAFFLINSKIFYDSTNSLIYSLLTFVLSVLTTICHWFF